MRVRGDVQRTNRRKRARKVKKRHYSKCYVQAVFRNTRSQSFLDRTKFSRLYAFVPHVSIGSLERLSSHRPTEILSNETIPHGEESRRSYYLRTPLPQNMFKDILAVVTGTGTGVSICHSFSIAFSDELNFLPSHPNSS
jgi:hypothetical protein